jgi:hypothetical protein
MDNARKLWKFNKYFIIINLQILLKNSIRIIQCNKKEGPPLWSRGQSSWLQIQRSGFDFRSYQFFLRSSGSGTGSTQPCEYNWGATWQKSIGSCLEIREYGLWGSSRWPRITLYPQNLALTSQTSGGRSVSTVSSRTHVTEFFLTQKKQNSVQYFKLLMWRTK